MLITIIALFVINAIAHIISYIKLRQIKAPNTMGVLIFVFINVLIVILLWQGLSWAKWTALIFPIIGGLGLFTTTILKGKGIWIDFIILVLDIVIVGLVLNHFEIFT